MKKSLARDISKIHQSVVVLETFWGLQESVHVGTILKHLDDMYLEAVIDEEMEKYEERNHKKR